MPTRAKKAHQDWATMRILGALTALLFLLAGCSDASPDGGADTALPPTDFGELDLVATSTTGIIRGLVVDAAPQ